MCFLEQNDTVRPSAAGQDVKLLSSVAGLVLDFVQERKHVGQGDVALHAVCGGKDIAALASEFQQSPCLRPRGQCSTFKSAGQGSMP